MNNQFDILKEAHQKYVDWWLPIDVANNSVMAPMARHMFCETLLTYEDDWFNRWIEDSIPTDKKVAFKKRILQLIIFHYLNKIDLNSETIEIYES